MSNISKTMLRRMARRAEHMAGRALELYSLAQQTHDDGVLELAGKAFIAAEDLETYLKWRLK